jgi:hypothetical protein
MTGLVQLRWFVVPASCVLAAVCAAGQRGPEMPVAARSETVLGAAERVLLNEGIRVRDRIGTRDQTRIRSFAFRPFEIWPARVVAERVVCTKDGQSIFPDGPLWLFVEVRARPVELVSWSGIPRSAERPSRVPTTLVGLSYDGRLDLENGRARCALSDSYAHALLMMSVGSAPPAMTEGIGER